MKKLLPTITAVILGSTFSPNISNAFSNNSNFTSNNWTWNNVQVNHNVATPATGTHEESNTKTDTKATVQPWSIFLNSQQIISNGYFALHTYDGDVYLNQDVATDIFRQWDFSQTNDVWQGWGHQTSTITLTVTAKYDESESLTSLFISSYIYARTAGSVHEASTTSQVTILEFIN